MAELNEQYQYLSEKPENLNDLELELFLANANFLTDHIEILRKINGSARLQGASEEVVQHPDAPVRDTFSSAENGMERPGEEPTAPDETPVIPQEQPSSARPAIGLNESQRGDEYEKPAGEISDEAPQSDDSLNQKAPEVQQPTVHAVKEPEPEAIRENTPPAVREPHFTPVNAEKPSVISEEVTREVVIPEKTITVKTEVREEEPEVIPTINEMISAKVNPSTVATRFTSHPVADLKSIISLNDKLLFVKDLFNGYSLAYSEAIELLNRFDTFEAADNFLKVNYAVKNNWNEKQAAVDKLYEALNRRFAK